MSASWIRILLFFVVALVAVQEAVGKNMERDARAPKPKFIRFGRGGGGQKFIRFGRSGAARQVLNPQDIYANQFYDPLEVDSAASFLDSAALAAPANDWQQFKRGGPKFIRFG
ncbi:hypothetical protein L596_029879 [Steinernema carpocapsae]|uniref:Uncharacterized protein n=1 Tax=Steinernema carpocapsae TaxID=34508 RepID=A0A4V5ZXD8_STECR|nr:hypothetical protein L596_029879 [Steinernema carpocapsae]